MFGMTLVHCARFLTLVAMAPKAMPGFSSLICARLALEKNMKADIPRLGAFLSFFFFFPFGVEEDEVLALFFVGALMGSPRALFLASSTSLRQQERLGVRNCCSFFELRCVA